MALSIRTDFGERALPRGIKILPSPSFISGHFVLKAYRDDAKHGQKKQVFSNDSRFRLAFNSKEEASLQASRDEVSKRFVEKMWLPPKTRKRKKSSPVSATAGTDGRLSPRLTALRDASRRSNAHSTVAAPKTDGSQSRSNAESTIASTKVDGHQNNGGHSTRSIRKYVWLTRSGRHP